MKMGNGHSKSYGKGNGSPQKTSSVAPKGGSGGNINMSNETRADSSKTVSHGHPFPKGLA